MDNSSDPICSRCGYSLELPLIDNRCPRCGSPIVASTQQIYLIAPEWLSKVRSGLIFASLAVGLCFVSLGASMRRPAVFPAKAFASASILWLIGMFLVTARTGRRNNATLFRIVLRSAVIVCCLLSFVSILAQVEDLGCGALAFWLLTIVFFFMYLQAIASKTWESLLVHCALLPLAIPAALFASVILATMYQGGIWPMGGGRSPSSLESVLVVTPLVLVFVWFTYFIIRMVRLLSPHKPV